MLPPLACLVKQWLPFTTLGAVLTDFSLSFTGVLFLYVLGRKNDAGRISVTGSKMINVTVFLLQTVFSSTDKSVFLLSLRSDMSASFS